MSKLGEVLEFLRAARIELRHLAFEEAQVGVIGGNRPEVRVPHDLGRDVWIVRIEQRKRLPRDIAEHAAMVRRELDLR